MFSFDFRCDPDLIARHIHAGIPCQVKLLISRLRRQILRDIHLRLRNTALHVVQKFHLGDLCKVIVVPHPHDLQRNLLHCGLRSKVDRDHAAFILSRLHGVVIQQKVNTLFQGNLNRIHLAFFHINNIDLHVTDRIIVSRIDRHALDRNPFLPGKIKDHRHRLGSRDGTAIFGRKRHAPFIFK